MFSGMVAAEIYLTGWENGSQLSGGGATVTAVKSGQCLRHGSGRLEQGPAGLGQAGGFLQVTGLDQAGPAQPRPDELVGAAQAVDRQGGAGSAGDPAAAGGHRTEDVPVPVCQLGGHWSSLPCVSVASRIRRNQ